MENDEEYSHVWLNLLLIIYIGIGSVGTFIINAAASEVGGYQGIGIFLSGAIFPLIAGFALHAFRHNAPDAVAITILYLAYNAAIALLNENWLPPVVDAIALFYLRSSATVDEVIPEDIRRSTTRLWLLVCAAAAGTTIQVTIACL